MARALPLRQHPLGERRAAFTRLEVAAMVGSVLLLLVLALPAVANKARSQQVGCFNNLRQIGRAFHLWANDHEDWFPFEIRQTEGGTLVNPGAATTAWVQYAALTNELGSPKVLVCPADSKRPASEFSTGPNGFMHANFRNNAVSYFLAHPYQRWPDQFLSGDSDLTMTYQQTGCSHFGNSVAAFGERDLAAGAIQWTNRVHMRSGNILSRDGHVQEIHADALSAYFQQFTNTAVNYHFLMP